MYSMEVAIVGKLSLVRNYFGPHTDTLVQPPVCAHGKVTLGHNAAMPKSKPDES